LIEDFEDVIVVVEPNSNNPVIPELQKIKKLKKVKPKNIK
jgi:hypothetical protein